MAAKVEDFQSYLEKKRAADIAAQEQRGEIAKATALHIDHVTHDPEWNIYLQKLQAYVDRIQATRDDLLTKIVMASPPEVHAGLLYSYWKCMGFLEAVDIAMKLPKAIMESVNPKTNA